MAELIAGAIIALVCFGLGFLFAVIIAGSRRSDEDG